MSQIVISRKDQLLEIDSDEPEMLHSILSKMPRPLNLDALISRAMNLFRRHPPESLPGRIWSQISTSSVLKTTRDIHELSQQTLLDGELYFYAEANEIRRREQLLQWQKQMQVLARRYRKPAVYTTAAVVVAFVALLVRGSTLPLGSQGDGGLWVGLQQRALTLWQRFTL